ncbi:MAG: hypothetical protein AB7S57_04910 [Acetobacteraceae bacterium]
MTAVLSNDTNVSPPSQAFMGDCAIGEVAAGLQGGEAELRGRPVHHHIAGIHQTATGRCYIILPQFGTLLKHPNQLAQTRQRHGDQRRFPQQLSDGMRLRGIIAQHGPYEHVDIAGNFHF